ncbi:sigma-70 family RNA polymerase sigma factor [Phytohabitans kaempferiae]|uniref:Sigma-70 family RNA polymerase sigma factor n=1 Tax=Phytohabitans kaempferiae TaxID=1620943 RepID=A0ABV6MHA3_9ACTN
MTQSEIEACPDVATLVAAAQAGDRAALDQLVAAHLPVIYTVVGRALNGHADVDDLVQDTMIKVMRGLPGLREPERFRSWAVAIAYRQVQQYLRERRRSRVRLHDAPPELPDPHADFADGAVAALALTGQRRELARAARWLDDGDRQLLALWWRESAGELTREEVAAALAINAKHAAVRLQRLRERLDAARCVVRALAARPRCPELAAELRGWNGAAAPLWRKRLVRHTRDCARCASHRRGLVPAEKLLLGLAALPLPVVLTEGVAAATAAPSIAHSLLGYLQNKLAVAATVTVVAGGGLTYAVVETPLLPSVAEPPPVAAPVAAPPEVPSAPASAPRAPRPAGPPDADIVVAPDGSDGGDGTLARPYATLAKAVATVRPGQTIALRGGTYRPTRGTVIETDGEPDRRITLTNYRDERPVIDASGVPADEWAVTHHGDHWTVRGLEVTGSRSHAYVCRSCRGNVFIGLSMHDNVRSGLTLRDPGTVDNQVLDSDFYRNYDPRGRGRAGIGLAIKFGDGTGNVIRGCRAFDNADSGFDVGHFADPVRLERNWAYGNGVNRWNAPEWQANADGFHLGGGSPAPAAAHEVRDNAAWDNVGHGFSDGGNPDGLRLAGNTAFRNGGIGFHLPTSAATLTRNAAIGNGTPAEIGDDRARSTGNTWDGGDWTERMFHSTDPATAQGPRQPGGALPRTSFLTSDSGMGAATG